MNMNNHQKYKYLFDVNSELATLHLFVAMNMNKENIYLLDMNSIYVNLPLKEEVITWPEWHEKNANASIQL